MLLPSLEIAMLTVVLTVLVVAWFVWMLIKSSEFDLQPSVKTFTGMGLLTGTAGGGMGDPILARHAGDTVSQPESLGLDALQKSQDLEL